MTTVDPLARSPLRTPRAWAALLIGVVFVGIGLGMMIDADFGVAPADALFTARKESGYVRVRLGDAITHVDILP